MIVGRLLAIADGTIVGGVGRLVGDDDGIFDGKLVGCIVGCVGSPVVL